MLDTNLDAQIQQSGILRYIKQGWSVLQRSPSHLAQAAVDPKSANTSGQKWPVYIAATENSAAAAEHLRHSMTPLDFASIELLVLPENAVPAEQYALLYLPHPYIVPGGRFNEMYGWDNFFIELGLLQGGELELARYMVDNVLYQVRHYGKVLNANRAYYLTRSQPPFLTPMVMALFHKTGDKAWLASTVDLIEKYYNFWLAEPHLTTETGLSRYYDIGRGPAPEVLSSELHDNGLTHYDLVAGFYRAHAVTEYDKALYYDLATHELTPLFYTGDRSMRESGFDISNRFGPFSVDVIHYNPVCLNSLLYIMERDMATVLENLARQGKAQAWQERARQRAASINQLMWNEQDGLYYDYKFSNGTQNRYPYLTTFYPLWAGIASPEQARRIVENLHLFEQPGGLQMGTHTTGNQWDAPFGWAPVHWIAVQGLRNYGFNDEANRISSKFLNLITSQFRDRGVIMEKYDVASQQSRVSDQIQFGYSSNEVGFGWTNGVFLDLYKSLLQ